MRFFFSFVKLKFIKRPSSIFDSYIDQEGIFENKKKEEENAEQTPSRYHQNWRTKANIHSWFIIIEWLSTILIKKHHVLLLNNHLLLHNIILLL